MTGVNGSCARCGWLPGHRVKDPLPGSAPVGAQPDSEEALRRYEAMKGR